MGKVLDSEQRHGVDYMTDMDASLLKLTPGKVNVS